MVLSLSSRLSSDSRFPTEDGRLESRFPGFVEERASGGEGVRMSKSPNTNTTGFDATL